MVIKYTDEIKILLLSIIVIPITTFILIVTGIDIGPAIAAIGVEVLAVAYSVRHYSVLRAIRHPKEYLEYKDNRSIENIYRQFYNLE